MKKEITKDKVREPLFHIIKRANIKPKQKILIYGIAIVGSFLLSSVICGLFAGKTPMKFFTYMFKALDTPRKLWELFKEIALLLGVSMALVPAFKMKFWNLGGNGQVLMGCLASATCMHFLGGKMADGLLILVMLVASLTAGIVWAVIPAIFKALFNTSESLFTLMMNYIAAGLVSTCIAKWVTSGSGVLEPMSYGNLPVVVSPQFLIIVLFFALTAFMFVYLKYSKHGYEISVVGESINTAKYIGINVKKVIIRTMILSGAIAGLVGFMITAGVQHTVSTASANNMGFTAIMTCWLAEFNPLMMFLTCGLVAFLTKGMGQVRTGYGFTNDSVSNVVVGLVYFCIIACSFFVNYKIVFRKKEEKKS